MTKLDICQTKYDNLVPDDDEEIVRGINEDLDDDLEDDVDYDVDYDESDYQFPDDDYDNGDY